MLIGVGEHVAAIRLLGANYSNAEYVEAVEAARATGAGAAYADAVLGVDVDALLRGVAEDDDGGDAVVLAAERHLRGCGIDPGKASYQEYHDALVEVSP